MRFLCALLFWAFLAVSVSADSLHDSVKHIVIFMQENRAFDHYFGNLWGVRGFNDRAAPPLPGRRPVWYQTISADNSSDYQLNWHVDTLRTSATCMDAPCMSYVCDILMWNYGKMDAWNSARDPGMGMSYFMRPDMPYYFQLADEFTIGDQYFQSTFTQTNPNRLFLFSGSNGVSVGRPAVLDNTEPDEGFPWITVGEILEANNVTWRVYQEEDNFDDNGFAWFASFKNAQPGSPLYEKGVRPVNDLVDAFNADMSAGTLPQVSWIIAPTALSEHATNHPAAGEDLTARLLKALGANLDVFKNTIFILNYDEGGQFFDHHWVPTPPTTDGISTVDTSGDIVKGEIDLPIGMGFRVPYMVISPWSRGGHVVSQVFDHSSVNQLLEVWLNISIPTLSPWRRVVAGDLLSSLDFDHPDYSWPTDLPDTNGYVEESNEQCTTLPMPQVPLQQSLATQEPGVRPSRTLPYQFVVSATADQKLNAFNVTIQNTGNAGAHFQMYDWNALDNPPRKYTISKQQSVTDSLSATGASSYEFSLHGPNGFVRYFRGGLSETACQVQTSEDVTNGYLVINLVNTDSSASTTCLFYTVDNAYGAIQPSYNTVYPTKSVQVKVPVAQSGNWYDITVTVTNEQYARRFMGRIERAGCTSDPAAGKNPLVQFTHPTSHPMNKPLVWKPRGMKPLGRKRSSTLYRNEKDSQRCYRQPFHQCMDLLE